MPLGVVGDGGGTFFNHAMASVRRAQFQAQRCRVSTQKAIASTFVKDPIYS